MELIVAQTSEELFAMHDLPKEFIGRLILCFILQLVLLNECCVVSNQAIMKKKLDHGSSYKIFRILIWYEL